LKNEIGEKILKNPAKTTKIIRKKFDRKNPIKMQFKKK
jgi:hypothetical protein